MALEFKVGADISQAIAATKNLDKAFDQVGNSATQMGASVASASKSVSGISPAVQKAQSAAVALNNSLKAVRPAANQATGALINVGRIAQDLPFGIIGIANNLNPLLESFQRTRKEAGSFTGTLKALGASLIGGGGIGLALSLASGALSFFALRSQGAKKEVKEVNEEAEKAKEAQKRYADAINSASSSLLGQVKNLKDLKAILISTEPEMKKLTEATIRQGVAALIFDKKNVAVQQLLNAEIEKGFKLREGSVAGLNEITLPTADPLGVGGKLPFAGLNKSAKEAGSEIERLNRIGAGLSDVFTKIINGTGKVDDGMDKVIERAKELEKEFPALFTALNFSALETKGEQFEKAKSALEKFFADLNNEFARSGTGINVGVEVPIKAPPETLIRPVAQETIDRLNTLFKDSVVIPVEIDLDPTKTQAIKDTLKGIKDTIANGISQSFNTFIDSIARGANAFQSFGQLVGDVVRSIITQLVKAVALAGILSLLSGGSSGGGLSFIKALGQVFGGARASGGPVSSGKAYLVGEKGPEIFRPSASGSIISNNNLASTGGRAPGVNAGGFIAETRIQAREIVLLIRREMKSQGGSV